MIPRLKRRGIAAFTLLWGLHLPIAAWAQATAPSAESDADVVPPELVREPPLSYPGDPNSGDVSVVVALTVNADGSVSDVALLNEGTFEFDLAALAAAPQLVFRPAQRAGEPIAARIQYAFRFVPPATTPVPSVPPPEQPQPPAQTSERVPATVAEEPEYGAVAEVEAPPTETTKRTIAGERLRELPGTRGDPIRAIEVMPGVGRTDLSDGAPRIRGAAGFESVTFVGGMPIPQLYHFGGLTSVVHPSLISEVSLYPGAFPARFGRATAGVVAAEIRDPSFDGFHGAVELGTLDASIILETPITEDVAVAVAGRRSTIDLFFDAFVPEDAYDVLSAPIYYDYQALTTIKLGKSKLKLFGLGSSDGISLRLSEPVDENPNVRGDESAAVSFQRVVATLNSPIDDGVAQQTSISYGHVAQTVRLAETDAKFDQHDLFGRSQWSFEVRNGLALRAGLDTQLTFLTGDYAGERPPQNEGDPDGNGPTSANNTVDLTDVNIRILEPAAYLEADWYPTEDLAILPSVRVDYFGTIEKASVDPRAAVRHRISDEMTLKVGGGRYTKAPLYYETIPELGNPDLRPTSAWQLSAGSEYQLFEGALRLDVEAYYKHLVDRVVQTTDAAAPYFINDGEGRVFGVEASAAIELGRNFYGYLAYSLSRSERQDHAEPYRLSDHDETHHLTATASHRFADSGWKIGARFRLTSGGVETPITGQVFDATTGRYAPLYGANNSVRRPLFHQLDARVEKLWDWDVFRLTAFIEVLNVYNAENVQSTNYSYDFREKETVNDGLPIFPSLGLRGEW